MNHLSQGQISSHDQLCASQAQQKAPNQHFPPQGRAQFPTKMIVEASDPRIAQLVALFGKMDERGKVTLLRMAGSMPGLGVKG